LTLLFRALAAELARRDEEGQGLAEYALILALIAIVAIASMIFLGGVINDLMSTIGATVDDNT
jgi:pilus assembly protein Flp/PilA